MQINGELVRVLRWEHGWTQAELAAKANVSANTVNSIEQGRSAGSPTTAFRLAQAFEIRVLDLVIVDPRMKGSDDDDAGTEAQVG